VSVPYKGITLDRTLRLYGNGKLPLSVLKQVHCGGTMYGPAAWWFNVMWEDAKKAGITLKATGRGYRPYGSQEAMFLDRYSRTPTLRKPVVTRKWKGATWWLKRGKSPSATPGFSNHGWGLAVDLEVPPTTFAWLVKNAPRYGFYLQGPKYLPNGKPNPEYEAWHWQFCNLQP
jgi:LAS superfamily LD-carboxypeptidase LdcB